MYGDAAAWHRLAALLSDVVADHLRAQAEAGAQALQVFDSWVGALAPRDYETAVLPHMRRLFDGLRSLGVPAIHFGTGTAGLLPLMARAGGDVIGVDWRIRLKDAWARVGGAGIQGNLDPAVMLAPFDVVEDAARDILNDADGRPGHVFNLGHGVLPQTPQDSLRRLVDLVHDHALTPPVGRR
jgi:uroporphyrinogen decarboxylase